MLYPVALPKIPEVRRPLSLDDKLALAEAEIASLERDIDKLKDKIRRLKEEVQDEIDIWTRLLATRQGEPIEAVKRRISRLKGALEYPGIIGF